MDGIDELVIEHLLELGSIDMLDFDGEYIDLRSELADLFWVGEAAIDMLLLAIRTGKVVDLLGRSRVTDVEQLDLYIETSSCFDKHAAELASAKHSDDSLFHLGYVIVVVVVRL